MTPIQLLSVTKAFGKTVAVDGINLSIQGGDLFFLLGPSGCGKTTLLRMIAGFTEPTSGRIQFGDDDVTRKPTNQRDTGMVFQGYALWPHMTVAENVGFGLTVGTRKKRFDAEQRKALVIEALETVQMGPYAERKINQLSGGQQQRVALARALVIKPAVLLLDEPLSNLDAKLRMDMRAEIRRICKQAKITGIYVTHDQKEALSMADGIAVLNQGKLVQAGPPQLLYRKPECRFVADFLGETNFLPGVVLSRSQDQAVLDTPIGPLTSTCFPSDMPDSGNVTCSVRPEAIARLGAGLFQNVQGEASGASSSGGGEDLNRFEADVVTTTYLGEMAQHRVQAASETLLKWFEINPQPEAPQGAVSFAVYPQDVVVLRD